MLAHAERVAPSDIPVDRCKSGTLLYYSEKQKRFKKMTNRKFKRFPMIGIKVGKQVVLAGLVTKISVKGTEYHTKE